MPQCGSDDRSCHVRAFRRLVPPGIKPAQLPEEKKFVPHYDMELMMNDLEGKTLVVNINSKCDVNDLRDVIEEKLWDREGPKFYIPPHQVLPHLLWPRAAEGDVHA